jgi:hypothetical protein
VCDQAGRVFQTKLFIMDEAFLSKKMTSNGAGNARN